MEFPSQRDWFNSDLYPDVLPTKKYLYSFEQTLLKTLQRMNYTRHSARADGNTHVIRSQSGQSKKLNFPTEQDHAFGLVNKRSGYEISLIPQKNIKI